MVQRRSMTDVEREDALTVCRFWQGFRESPVRSCLQTFLLAAFGIGVLAIGTVYFVLGWILEIPLPIQASIVLAVGLLGGIWFGIDDYRRVIRSNRSVVENDQRLKAAIDGAEVWVYSSATVKSHFDDDANSEHPPLVIDFGNGDILTIEAMEQDEFGINEEIRGECEVVTLPEGSPILSIRTSAETRRRSSDEEPAHKRAKQN